MVDIELEGLYFLPLGCFVHLNTEDGGYGVVVDIQSQKHPKPYSITTIFWLDGRYEEFGTADERGMFIGIGHPLWKILVAQLPESVLQEHRRQWQQLKQHDQEEAFDLRESDLKKSLKEIEAEIKRYLSLS